ncbi:MAG: AtpZ/AtpI family protein [Candidatus Magasanikbacteria bacterium]|nr:AtpZ/AtpI family protein [Candidatus Magasanikbacteria bacterium]
MEEQNKPKNDHSYYLFALKIVGDFGATISIPIVALALLGKYLDERWQTGPWLLILGFALSLLISGKIIYRKAKKYGREYQKLR